MARRLLEPAGALLAAAILLPIGLFALAAWQSYTTTLREAESRVERTTRILEEHALKVFETHRLVIEQVNGLLRYLDLSKETDRLDLHLLLSRLQDDLDQVATITVVDRDGRLLSSGRVYPADSTIRFTDRDYFRVLKQDGAPSLYVSRAYVGRTSGMAIFNVAARARFGARPTATFQGAVAVSVDRSYFEDFYRSVEPTFDHSVVLVREDGAILAATPPLSFDQLPTSSNLYRAMKRAPSGVYRLFSGVDGVERIAAYRKIGPYPVYVRFGISLTGALAPWWHSLYAYGFVAVLASLALVAVSMLAIRQTDRERLARRAWQEAAAALQAEATQRGKVEAQLRQSQKMEAVGRLTGGVAHDFNNLLTAVIGSLDLVRRRPERIDARGLDLVINALEGANRAAALTSRLLAFSRQQPLQPTRLDANALVAGMIELLRRSLGEHVAIETRLGDGLWATNADANQVESALLNLAVNARDAMPEGGRLTIETGNAELDAAYAAAAKDDVAPGAYVMIAVTDSGTGMTAEVLANIFEPFFTTKPLGKGTGLGLSQVYGFVRQSGGHLSVYSEPGQGSSFKIYLPRCAAGAAEVVPRAEPASPASVRRGNGETILVVEDEPMVRRLSITALEDAGYRVLAAADGPAGLDLFRRNRDIALLFTDVVLGGAMDGRALADRVLAERPDLPVLFTTGYTRNAIVHDGRLDADVAFIGKPFTSAALVAKVGDLLPAPSRSVAVAAAV